MTPRQARFVAEYLVDFNATQAAARAGYSVKWVNTQGSRLLKRPHVQAAIAAAQQERAQRLVITADRVLEELMLIGFADMGDYLRLTPDGRARFDWSDLPAGATKAIAEITQEEFVAGRGKDGRRVRRTKFKLHDKRAALVDIGRHLGLFVTRHEVFGKDGQPIKFTLDFGRQHDDKAGDDDRGD